MKPFNLQAALAGKKVVTRTGENVERIIEIPDAPKGYELMVIIASTAPFFADTNGCCFLEEENDFPSYDLFMASEKKTGWVNLYIKSHERPTVGLSVYPTEEIARKFAGANAVQVKIEWWEE
jgi:hypothetical protein